MSFSSSASKRFDCSTCKPATAKRRMCETNKFDYDGNDSHVFPIVVEEGGKFFGFCPGKANWYPDVVATFKTMVICCELNLLPFPGALVDQPSRIVEMLSWFAPIYNGLSTAQRHGLLKSGNS